MNDVFSIKRFALYLSYELRCAAGEIRLFFLAAAGTPLIALIVLNILTLVTDGGFFCHSENDILLQQFEITISTATFVIVFPSKLYGRLTDPKAGAEYLTFPVSILEKSLSMILTLVLLSLTFYGVILGLDALLCTLFKTAYLSSTPFVRYLCGQGILGAGIMRAITYPLIFGTGAICFKKHKITKTALCLLPLYVIISAVMPEFFESVPAMLALCPVLCAGIYLKIKTIRI